MPSIFSHGRRTQPLARLALTRNIRTSGEVEIDLTPQEATVELEQQETTITIEQLPEIEIEVPS